MAEGMRDELSVPAATPGRRRLGNMLSAYYGTPALITPTRAAPAAAPPIDRQGFDASQSFDDLVAVGSVADVLRRANEVNAQVNDLDGDMNMVIYENYSKFIRATEVTGLVKSSVNGLEPDMDRLESSFVQIAEHQRKVDEKVSGRAREIELLLKRQRVCKKLQLLFELPTTLQRCLDRGAYNKACEAYSKCVRFLRQHKEVNTFRAVLEDVEHQMGRIRSALDLRLRSSELSSKDAVNSSLTLLDLGDEPGRILQNFLSGRTSGQRAGLRRCVADEDGQDADAALSHFCQLAADSYIPELVDAVHGFGRIREAVGGPPAEGHEDRLSDFVSTSVEELCLGVAELVETRRPSVEVLVGCITELRDALQRLHSSMPRLLAKLFSSFLSRITTDATRLLFERAAAQLLGDLAVLHGGCGDAATAEDALRLAGEAEECLLRHVFGAVDACQPLLGSIVSDKAACQQLARTLEDQLEALVGTVCEGCFLHLGMEPRLDLPALHVRPAEGLEALHVLEYRGLFVLALVWLLRRFEGRVAAKAYGQAHSLFLSAESGADVSGLQAPAPAVGADLKRCAEASLGHFVRASGHRLIQLLRESAWNEEGGRRSSTPVAPTIASEVVLKEVQLFDAAAAKILADPRKGRVVSKRNFTMSKSSMELEIERQWAKKMQVFAVVPYTRSGTVSSIFQVVLKALFEHAREETFTTFGLQQFQANAEVLGDIAREFVEAEDYGALESLLAEAVSSGAARCSEVPTLLDGAALESICGPQKALLLRSL